MSGGRMAAVGASVAAIGAGAYYLMKPKAKALQKKASKGVVMLRKEIMQKAMMAKSMTKPLYDNAVDTLAAEYGKEYKDSETDIKILANKLKGEWKGVAKKIANKSVKIIKDKSKSKK
jgi:hypothetical protein